MDSVQFLTQTKTSLILNHKRWSGNFTDTKKFMSSVQSLSTTKLLHPVLESKTKVYYVTCDTYTKLT